MLYVDMEVNGVPMKVIIVKVYSGTSMLYLLSRDFYIGSGYEYLNLIPMFLKVSWNIYGIQFRINKLLNEY